MNSYNIVATLQRCVALKSHESSRVTSPLLTADVVDQYVVFLKFNGTLELVILVQNILIDHCLLIILFSRNTLNPQVTLVDIILVNNVNRLILNGAYSEDSRTTMFIHLQ